MGFIISCSSSKDFSEYENVNGQFIETGVASWYGPNFHGNKTANGERFNTNKLTAAHRTLPFNSIVRVINTENSKSVIVRINDRGPFAKDRIIDLSRKAAEELEMIGDGTAKVELYLLSNESKMPINIKVPHFTVQVGSYTNKNDAIRASKNIENSRIVEATIDRKLYYRIYVGLFANKNQAEELKDNLQQNGVDGFVKQVGN